MIVVKELTKKYNLNEEATALNGIDVTFGEFGFVSILGPSGCGKSTLLNMIGLLDRPTSGEIIIDGVSTKSLTSSQEDKFRNQKIGFIFQSYHLIPTLSILDNVTLPLEVKGDIKPSERKARALEILKKIGLEKYIDKKVNELSGGMKQRVAIARALILNPEIILADEPTGALDSKNSEEVLNILKDISKTKLVILVTHNEKEAAIYSDRTIRMYDGKIVEDLEKEVVESENKISSLGPLTENPKKSVNKLMKTKNIITISFKSFMSKKLKTILTSVANCFGLVALGFVLAITNGFNIYKEAADNASASNLPINVPAYSTKSATEDWKDVNQSEKYPTNNEIYPYIPGQSTVTYTYNNYSDEYFDLLDELKEEGLIQDYLFNYGNDYAYNLTTKYPESLKGQYESSYQEVYTSLSAGGSYTSSTYGIPTNIFHVLYGNIEDGYDLIAGKYPSNENELILVVNEYNAINFETLRNLGFYNLADTKEEVQDLTSANKVKPINFNDIIGKEYKIFSNNELYVKNPFTKEIYDQFSYKSGVVIPVSKRTISTYTKKDYETLFNDNSIGEKLTISGILRPKKDSTLSLISPSLCYLPELQEKLIENKKDSDIASILKENVVYLSDNPNNNLDIVDDLNKLINSHKDDISGISTTEINEIADKYFRYYAIDKKLSSSFPSGANTFTYFIKQAKKFGVDLVNDETKEVLSSGDLTKMEEFIKKVLGYFKSVTTKREAYEYFISLVAFMNSYNDILNVAIFPTGMFERSIILKRLDEFNDSRGSEKEKIYYYDNGNFMIEEVGNMVSLISLVLMIFVCVLICVACVMNVLFTYNNVLERKKDIGIFRAIGMRKFDVSRVFIFEASIVGTLSGLMSVLFTYLLEFPVNYQVRQHYSDYWNISNICVMAWWHIVLLILLGLILGIISAIIPSYYAANKDPVKCLKEE